MSKYYTKESDGSITFHDIDLVCKKAREHIEDGNDHEALLRLIVNKLTDKEMVRILDQVEQVEKEG